MYGEDDPSWIADIWEGCVQETNENEPDYFDVLEDVLADHGGFEEIFLLFSQYRYFVGSNDDGAHLPEAGMWTGSEVAVDTHWSWDDLPVTDGEPSPGLMPQPNGAAT